MFERFTKSPETDTKTAEAQKKSLIERCAPFNLDTEHYNDQEVVDLIKEAGLSEDEVSMLVRADENVGYGLEDKATLYAAEMKLKTVLSQKAQVAHVASRPATTSATTQPSVNVGVSFSKAANATAKASEEPEKPANMFSKSANQERGNQ